MKKIIIASTLLISVLQAKAQEVNPKNEQWITSIGVNFGQTGMEHSFLAIDEDRPNNPTTNLFNIELSAKRRITSNSDFFLGVNIDYSKANYSGTNVDYSWRNYKEESDYEIINIGPALSLVLKNKSGKVANYLSIMPSYSFIKYDLFLDGKNTMQAKANGFGAKFEYAPLFYIRENLSIGPKVGCQRFMFGNFKEEIIITDERNFNFEKYNHFQLTFGILVSLHF